MVTELVADTRPSTPAAAGAGAAHPARALAHDPAYQASFVLRSAFVVAPLLFGLDAA